VRLGATLGVDPGALTTSLQHGSSRSFALDLYANMREDFGDPNSPVAGVAALLAKDLRLVESLIATNGVDGAQLTSAAAEVLRQMIGDASPPTEWVGGIR
jgi:3-hydroxyisobutyrate dehydrogenase-like beta-hydroxyacid dehydrogenase